MCSTRSHGRKNLLAATLGAIGRLLVALASKCLPKIMPQIKKKMASACPCLKRMDGLVQPNWQIVAASTGTPAAAIECPETSTGGASQDVLATDALRTRFADVLALRGRRITFTEMSAENQEVRGAFDRRTGLRRDGGAEGSR